MVSRTTSEAAFERCSSLLRRGVLSGDDVQEILDELEATIGNIGLWFSVGRVDAGAEQIVRNIDPSWPDAYLPYANEDPCRAYLVEHGSYAVFDGEMHAPDETWKTPLGIAFRKAGWSDVAVVKIASAHDGELVAYRPRGLPPFEAATLARLGALAPLFDLAFAPSSAQRAIGMGTEDQIMALARVGAHAILGREPGDIIFSKAAEHLFARLFDGFGARGRKRIERALRLGYARLCAQKGTRLIALRADLSAELTLLPRPGHDAFLIATFVHRDRAIDQEPRPCDELLSRTQRVVARRIAEGMNIPALARELQTSTETVKAHLREIYRRLGIESRTELAELYTTR